MHPSTVSHLSKCSISCHGTLHSVTSPYTAGRRPWSVHASTEPLPHANASISKANASQTSGRDLAGSIRPRSRSPQSYHQRRRQPPGGDGLPGELNQQQEQQEPADQQHEMHEHQQAWNQQQKSAEPVASPRRNRKRRKHEAERQRLPRQDQLRQKQMGAQRDLAASFFVHAARLDEICEGLRLYEGVLSPSMLAHTVGPKLSSLLGKLPESSPHRRWGVEALARFFRAITPSVPALRPTALLQIFRVLRTARQAKVLQMRGVSFFLYKQHAQQQERRAVAAGVGQVQQEGAAAPAPPPSAAGSSLSVAPTTAAEGAAAAAWDAQKASELSWAGFSVHPSSAGSRRTSKARDSHGADDAVLAEVGLTRGSSSSRRRARSAAVEQDSSTAVGSWIEDQYASTAQLLRVLRMRVLRLCAASVPASSVAEGVVRAASFGGPAAAATDSTNSAASVVDSSNSSGGRAHEPSPNAAAVPSAAATQDSNGAAAAANSAAATAAAVPLNSKGSATAATSLTAAAPAAAASLNGRGGFAALPSDSAAGGAEAKPAPGEAGLIVRLMREMLDVCIPWTCAQGHVAYAFLEHALDEDALSPREAVSGLCSMARLCPLPLPPDLTNKLYMRLLGMPNLREAMTVPRLERNPAVLHDREASGVPPDEVLSLPSLMRLMAKDRLQRKAAVYTQQQQEQQQHGYSRSQSSSDESGSSSSTGADQALGMEGIWSGLDSHLPQLASVVGADMMPTLQPWPGEEANTAVCTGADPLFAGTSPVPVEADRLAEELYQHLLSSKACRDINCFNEVDLAIFAATWRSAGMPCSQAARQELATASAPFIATDVPISGLAMAQLLGLQLLHVERETGNPGPRGQEVGSRVNASRELGDSKGAAHKLNGRATVGQETGNRRASKQRTTSSNTAKGDEMRVTGAEKWGAGARAEVEQQMGRAAGVEASPERAAWHEDQKRDMEKVEQQVWDRRGGWNWQVAIELQQAVRRANSNHHLPGGAGRDDAPSGDEAQDARHQPRQWLSRYCKKASRMMRLESSFSVPMLWGINARLVQLQLRAPSLLLLPLLPIGPMQPGSSGKTTLLPGAHVQQSAERSRAFFSLEQQQQQDTEEEVQQQQQHQQQQQQQQQQREIEAQQEQEMEQQQQQQQDQCTRQQKATPQQEQVAGQPTMQQQQHQPQTPTQLPLLYEVVEQLALAVGAAEGQGWDDDKVWDGWLSGRPFSSCGCLPDLPGVVVLMEHLACVAFEAGSMGPRAEGWHSTAPIRPPSTSISESKKWSLLQPAALKVGRKTASTTADSMSAAMGRGGRWREVTPGGPQSMYQGYSWLEDLSAVGSGQRQREWETCSAGWGRCRGLFCGTRLLEELLLHCADAELARIGCACMDPGQRASSILEGQAGTLRSNRAAFLHSSTTWGAPGGTDGDLGGALATPPEHPHSSTNRVISNRSSSGSSSSSGDGSLDHTLQLVLRFANAAHALGLKLHAQRRDALLVVLVRLLKRSLSLPAYVHMLHLFAAMQIEVSRDRSTLLAGTVLGMAQSMLEQPRKYLLPCVPAQEEPHAAASTPRQAGLQQQAQQRQQQQQADPWRHAEEMQQAQHAQQQQQQQQQRLQQRGQQDELQLPPLRSSSLLPVITLLRSLHAVRLGAGLALDVALSHALQYTFLTPEVYVAAEELLELLYLMSNLKCMGNSGALGAVQWQLNLLTLHVASEPEEAAAGALTTRSNSSSSSSSSRSRSRSSSSEGVSSFGVDSSSSGRRDTGGLGVVDAQQQDGEVIGAHAAVDDLSTPGLDEHFVRRSVGSISGESGGGNGGHGRIRVPTNTSGAMGSDMARSGGDPGHEGVRATKPASHPHSMHSQVASKGAANADTGAGGRSEETAGVHQQQQQQQQQQQHVFHPLHHRRLRQNVEQPRASPRQALRALHALLNLGVMPAPQLAARLLKAALFPAGRPPEVAKDEAPASSTSRSKSPTTVGEGVATPINSIPMPSEEPRVSRIQPPPLQQLPRLARHQQQVISVAQLVRYPATSADAQGALQAALRSMCSWRRGSVRPQAATWRHLERLEAHGPRVLDFHPSTGVLDGVKAASAAEGGELWVGLSDEEDGRDTPPGYPSSSIEDPLLYMAWTGEQQRSNVEQEGDGGSRFRDGKERGRDWSESRKEGGAQGDSGEGWDAGLGDWLDDFIDTELSALKQLRKHRHKRS